MKNSFKLSTRSILWIVLIVLLIWHLLSMLMRYPTDYSTIINGLMEQSIPQTLGSSITLRPEQETQIIEEKLPLLIHFVDGTTEAERDAHIASLQGEMVLWIEPLNVANILIPASIKSGLDLQLVDAASTERVLLYEPDGFVYGTGAEASENSADSVVSTHFNTIDDFTLTTYETSDVERPADDKVIILIYFKPTVTEEERDELIAGLHGELILWIEPLHVAKVVVPHSELIAIDNIPIGRTSSAVVDIEEEQLVFGIIVANDPDLNDPQRMYTPELLHLNEAWAITTGSPETTLAILDTGIALNHPEFTQKIVDGYDFHNNDDEPEDDHGHGSHVAGIAAAAINNHIGGAGICGDCSIMPVKVLNENNVGTWSSVAAGIVYAADKGADVIIMSLGATAGTVLVEEAIRYAQEKDVIIVAAAGNANSSRDFYPAAYEGVVGVAATDSQDKRWLLSNYRQNIDISAPGHRIYSTHTDLDNSYQGHAFMNGTSMATPHVGGLLGLIKSQDRSRTGTEIVEILYNSAVKLGGISTKNDYFGYGRIDPVSALTLSGASSTDHSTDFEPIYLPYVAN